MKSIENELVDAALLNGKTFIWGPFNGCAYDQQRVYNVACGMMRAAIKRGIVSPDDLARSDVYAQMQRDERDAHMAELSNEESRLQEELASLDGDDAEGDGAGDADAEGR